MDANTVKSLQTKVPTFTHRLDITKIETYKGSNYRNRVVFLTLIPLIAMFDLNGGLTKLGFTRTTFQSEFKARPDYATGTLFVAHRQDVPEIKHF